MKSFHSFRLDTLNHCLWLAEERVPIPRKTFDVLRYLVEHAGKFVTQDEMLEGAMAGDLCKSGSALKVHPRDQENTGRPA